VKAAYKPVLLTALITSAVCLVHFFSAVYVPSHDEQRSLSIPTLSVLPQGVPYQPQALQSTIAQWLIPADGAAKQRWLYWQYISGNNQLLFWLCSA
jgi:hypothetical protein